jgi:hypothetical protein
VERVTAAAAAPLRLSIVLEWANTRLHGVPRAHVVLEALSRQWREIAEDRLPATLAPEARGLLRGLDRRADLVIVSGEPPGAALEEDLKERLSEHFDVRVELAEGLEYYPLKNFGAGLARGGLLLFVDSDVLPEEGWLAHLLGSFADPGVSVVCGQTYVAPTDVFARAFALGWTYELRDDSGRLVHPRKFYANNIAFRREVFDRTGFRPLGRRSRGAVSLLRADLDGLGIPIWENRMARVDHPPPTSVRHMVVRALAHGRDMKDSQARTLRGLERSVGVAWRRLRRGFARTFAHWRTVGLRRRDVPAALLIISAYYGLFALGGVLTHVHPAVMGRHFRV